MPTLEALQVDSVYYTGLLNKRWCSYLLADEPDRTVLVRANGSPLWSAKGHFWMPDGPALEIYPRDEWFNIVYILSPGGTLVEYYVNIAMPPTLSGRLLTYIDLDLDIGVNRDFTYKIHDEDEFLSHCELWSYPPELCEKARAAFDAMLSRVANHDPLFGEWEQYRPIVPAEFLSGDSAALIPPTS